MSTEEKLKAYILSKYKSLRQFVMQVGIPYSTVATIFNRGIMNCSSSTILKLCDALGISADELADGNIVPKETAAPGLAQTDINSVIAYAKLTLLDNPPSIDGVSMTQAEIDTLFVAVDVAIGIIKSKRGN